MEYDLTALDRAACYRILTGTVVPRPIAWITSTDTAGRLNAAPFSFFNAVGADPPTIVVGFSAHPDGRPKHTAHNIQETGVFVVNLVPESLSQAMNRCATDYEAGVNEMSQAGLETQPSVTIDTPRIAGCPVQFECRQDTMIHRGQNRLLLGEVLHAAIGDRYLLNPEKPYIDTNALSLIGRMGAPATYTKTRDLFEMPRLEPPAGKGR